ncbi:hypothetical protein L6164_023593 [Bauhinia variegata]|uniref:Uncharacterized protein n=1 Tax=Bauhinia variegata TaxID=167791 RepID=A0ACB9MIU6_BAUVA|nr:hypothetical protein L6164_023593 [Bauhinia variegata]
MSILSVDVVRAIQDTLSNSSERQFRVEACPPGIGVCEGEYGDRFFTWNLYYSYRCGVSLPFIDFEMEVLDNLQIAPTQLHPNAWATLHAFQGICANLGRPARMDVFFYFYFLKNPRKHEVGYLYFSARKGRSLILPAKESVKHFKKWFFRITDLPFGRPFFIDEEGKPRFPLQWRRHFGKVEEVSIADLGPAMTFLVKELESRVYADQTKAVFKALHFINRKTMPNLRKFIERSGIEAKDLRKKKRKTGDASSFAPSVADYFPRAPFGEVIPPNPSSAVEL